MAAVSITTFGAECGDLHHTVFGDNPYGTMLQACQYQFMVLEYGPGLLRKGGGAKIIVLGFLPQHRVPNAAAYDISREAGSLQRVQTFGDIPG
jgi:hypothetical protein